MEETIILRTVVGISFLIFMAKLLAIICGRFKMPRVIGEVLAGVIFGPYALGGRILLFGEPIVQINEITSAFSFMGGIVVLFAAGLEFTFTDFIRAGVQPLVVGIMGVVTPFFMGIAMALLINRPWTTGLVVGAAMAATSIAITVRTLEEMQQLQTDEAILMINAAVIDDVLSLATLGIVTSIAVGEVLSMTAIIFETVYALLLWFLLLVGSTYIIPRLINRTAMWRASGIVEAAATISCFGLAFIFSMMGLSPVVGAFAAGMAIAGSRAIALVREYIEKLNMIFAPLFFATVGMYLNPSVMLNIDFILLLTVFSIAILSKVMGCGLPSAFFLKNRERGLRVGIGMLSRGEVGFIVAGISLTSGLVTESTYTALVIVILTTTLITPYLLKEAFKSSDARQ